MNFRVTMGDLAEYVNSNSALFNLPPYFGFYLGKQWSGTFTNNTRTQSGWIEKNGSALSYPPYDYPSDLPDWANAKRESFTRALIGSGTNTIGPFTLQEVLYIYTVVRSFTIDISGGSPSASAESRDANVSVTSSPQLISKVIPEPLIPDTMFYDSDERTIGGERWEGDADDFEFTAGDDVFVDTGIDMESYPNIDKLIIDVDNVSDYYIEISEPSFGSIAYASGTSEAVKNGIYNANIFSQKAEEKYLSLRMTKSVYTYANNIKDLGESYTIDNSSSNATTTTTSTITYTIVSHTATFNFGIVSKQITLWGIRSDFLFIRQKEGTGQNDPDPPAIPNVVATCPMPTLSFNADLYWPCKTTDGKPVYNTTTGAIVNSPLS